MRIESELIPGSSAEPASATGASTRKRTSSARFIGPASVTGAKAGAAGSGGGRGRDRVEAPLGDLLLAHLVLLDLPGHRHREAVDEAHVERDLEARDPAVAEGSELVLVERRALAED